MTRVREKLFEVARIENGWLVTLCDEWGHDTSEVFYGTWEGTETALRRHAFPFPDPTEPRGPRPFGGAIA